MTYRCHVCSIISKPNQSKLTYAVMRTVPPTYGTRRFWSKVWNKWCKESVEIPQRQEIAQEIEVCPDHKACLEAGIPLVALMRQNENNRRLRTIKPKKVKAKQLAKAMTRPSTTRPSSNRPAEVFLGVPTKLHGMATKRRA